MSDQSSPEPFVAGIATNADADNVTEATVFMGTPAWAALMEWLKVHEINPNRVLAGSRISRDEIAWAIRYVRIVDGPDGEPLIVGGDLVAEAVVEQGEGPPLPYPPEVRELLR